MLDLLRDKLTELEARVRDLEGFTKINEKKAADKAAADKAAADAADKAAAADKSSAKK